MFRSPIKFLLRLVPALVAAAFLAACAASGSGPATGSNSYSYQADTGARVVAEYHEDDTVTLTFPDGQKETLKLAVSASGARFVHRNHEWWEHQGEATYRVGERLVFQGQRQP